MKTALLPASLVALFVFAGICASGPVEGRHRMPARSVVLHPGEELIYKKRFKANERACVIVVGDHDPVMNLSVKVFDASKQEVARDEGGDVLTAIWYPSQEGDYTIQIEMLETAKVPNLLQLVFK